ncbi:MAG: acylphosphatase [Akkermansiaceae bacterium]|jgi:acylphosphatase|nr:acylphosphatase [Akkermansiaceae bacterium]
MTAKRVIFSGRVQGVGFRYSVKQLALGFEVVGWIKNLKDGTVELQLMGEADEVNDFIKEITDESDLAGLVKDHIILDIDLLVNVQGFRTRH